MAVRWRAQAADFVTRLKSDLGYRTSGSDGPTPSPAACATLRYYLGLLRIVIGAHALARTGRLTDEAYLQCSLRTLRLVESLGGRIEVTGIAHLAGEGPVVLIGNHMSLLETFLLPCLLIPFRRTAFVVKEDLLRYPLFGLVMRTVPHIAVTRANPREDLRRVLEDGLTHLRAGFSIVLFPQATRRPLFDPAALNSLGSKLSRRAGAPVIPVAIRTDMQGIGRVVRDMGRVDPRKPVRVAFGPPVPPAADGRSQHEAVVAFIAARMREWGVPVLKDDAQGRPAPSEGAAPTGAA